MMRVFSCVWQRVPRESLIAEALPCPCCSLFGGSDDGEEGGTEPPSQAHAEDAAGAVEEVRRYLAGLMARGALPPPWPDPSAHAEAALPGLPPCILRAAVPQQAQQAQQAQQLDLGAGGGWAPRGAQKVEQEGARHARRGLFQPPAAWDAMEEDAMEEDGFGVDLMGEAAGTAAGGLASGDLGGGAGDEWDDAPDFLEAVSGAGSAWRSGDPSRGTF